MQLVSQTFQWKDLFRRLRTSGEQTKMLSTPNRFLRWVVVLSQRDGQYQVVNNSHRVVATCYERDDAECIVAEHNRALRAREEWQGA